MFEIFGTFVVLTILFFVTGGHKKNPNVGKYSRERQLKKYYETGKIRYLYDRDYDWLLFVFLRGVGYVENFKWVVMFEILIVLVALFIIGWRGRNKPDTGKYSRERQLKNITKRVTNVICMIVIMTDCCLSFCEV